MDWPNIGQVNRLIVHAQSPQSGCFSGTATLNATPGDVAHPTANMAYFIPFVLYEPAVVKKLLIANGATVSGNIDAGIYSADGTRLVSMGTTAMSGVSVIQGLDITDTLLGRGLFFLAFACDNATASFFGWNTPGNIGVSALTGIYQMASAFVLPATATFAAQAINSRCPLVMAEFNTVL